MASNGGLKQRSDNGVLDEKDLLQRQVDGLATDRSSSGSAQTTKNLVICVGGIYASLYAPPIYRDAYTVRLTCHQSDLGSSPRTHHDDSIR
jgi:UDP-galactose transporter B1